MTHVHVTPDQAVLELVGLGIRCTKRHPFLTSAGAFKAAEELRPGDRLVRADNDRALQRAA